MNLLYLIKETFRTINRNREQFVLSSVVLGICLLLLSLFLMVTLNIMNLVKSSSELAEVYAFVDEEITNSPLLLETLEQRIASIAGVVAVRFFPKEQALEELRRDLGPDTTVLTVLGENPIPPSIRIKIHPDYTTPEHINTLEQKLLLLPGITEVWSGKEFVAQLNQALKTAVVIDIIFLIIIVISVLFIVFQTVENSVLNRSEEIQIMELVGASRIAIHTPFFIQGALQGLLGSVLSGVLLFLVYRIIKTFIPFPIFIPAPFLAGEIVLGIILGLGGTFIALARIPSTLLTMPAGFHRKFRTSKLG